MMYVIKTMGEGVDGVGGVDSVDGVAWYTIWFRSSNGWEEKRVIVLKAMLIICPPEHKCAGQTVWLATLDCRCNFQSLCTNVLKTMSLCNSLKWKRG